MLSRVSLKIVLVNKHAHFVFRFFFLISLLVVQTSYSYLVGSGGLLVGKNSSGWFAIGYQVPTSKLISLLREKEGKTFVVVIRLTA